MSLSPLDVFIAIVSRGKQIALVGLASMILALTVALLWAPEYTSTAALLAQAPSGSASRLQGLASQFGVSIAGTTGGTSPELYAGLLRSENVLRAVADARYAIIENGATRTGDLGIIFGTQGARAGDRRRAVLKKLRKALTTSVDDPSGVVEVRVTTVSPQLSLQIAQQLIRALDSLNNALRQKQANAETRFMESRVEEQRGALRQAEDRVAEFMTRNRQFQSDPQLALEYNRLMRAVQMRQEIYTSLSQGLEQVRIDAARSTPSVALVEEPLLPDGPQPKKPFVVAVAAFLLGISAAIVAALGNAYYSVLRASNPRTAARLADVWLRLAWWRPDRTTSEST